MMLDFLYPSRTRCARRRAPARAFTHVEGVERRLLFATFTVTNTNDSGAGSLRDAIEQANLATNPEFDVDMIEFAIPGTGIPVIRPLTPLPEITDGVWIDALGESEVDTPRVELDGSLAGPTANGLVLASSDEVFSSFVSGLIINRFGGNGILITGDGNVVGLNYIGTNASGTAAGPGNGGHGVLITSNGNFVSDNVIGFNAGDGIAVTGTAPTGGQANDIALNDFFQNGGLAIDLGNDGPTANDPGDADTGPNELQNYPVLTATAAAGGGVTISGTVNSTPNTWLSIAVYSNPAGEDEGRTFLEHFDEVNGQPVVTDAAGNYTFTRTYAEASQAAAFTATATELFVDDDDSVYAFSTSEMSPPASIGGGANAVTNVFARGSTWATSTFLPYLQAQNLGSSTYGYRIPTRPAGQEDVLPWINVNQLVVEYQNAMTSAPAASTIFVDGVRGDYAGTATLLDPTHVLYTLSQPLGGNPATTATNGDRFRLTVADGAAGGGTYELRFNVVQGDVNKSRSVLADDFSDVKKKFFRSTGNPGPAGDTQYTAFHDVNGSGSILADDFSEVKKRFFHGLPAATVASSGDSLTASVTGDLFGTQAIL
jgi:hypothetical protein